MKRLILISAAALSLTACDFRPDHAEWQRVCTREETTLIMTPTSYDGGKTMSLMPQYVPSCVEYGAACVAGKDGSTECPAN